jgi:DNA-binding MarR family transcriptional regulator
MEMQLLRCFVAVGEERHISHAAERLNIAQPTLSEAIRLLERELGLGLVIRLRHGVALTAAGRTLLPIARRVLADLDEGVRAAKAAEAEAARLLRVGYVCDVDPELISAIAEEFRRRRRDWRLEMRRKDPSDATPDALDGGDAVTLLRLPTAGDDTLEGTVHSRDPHAGPFVAEPFSLTPFSLEPAESGQVTPGQGESGPVQSRPVQSGPVTPEPVGPGPFMAQPDPASPLREFLLAPDEPADQIPPAAPDALDVSEWFGDAVMHQAIGVTIETSVTGPPGGGFRDVETVAPGVLSAVWSLGDADPVIADFLQACIVAVRDRTPRKVR